MAKKQITMDLDTSFRNAAQEYWRVREDFIRVDGQLKTLPMESEADRTTLRSAWRASARAKMRVISNRVARFNLAGSTPLACKALALKEKIEIEHAVPVNLVHNWILGIDRTGGYTAQVQAIHDQDDIERFIRGFVVGVQVLPAEHRQLSPQSMPKSSDPWSLENRMGRYKDLAVHKIGECEHCAKRRAD